MPISRDISDLNSVILKCKRERLRNLDPRSDRPALQTKLNVSAVVPLTDGGFNPSIRRGNLRPMGSPLCNSADHLYERGNLQGVPTPMRRSLTVLNSIRDITMARGEVIEKVGQRSPRSIQVVMMMRMCPGVRLLIMMVNNLPGLPHLVLMMNIWLGARLLIMLVNDLLSLYSLELMI